MPDDTVPGTLEELRPWLRDMRAELRANTEATKRIEQNTKAIVETFENARGFWNTVAWLGDVGGKLIKACAALALVGGAVWLWIRDHVGSRGG